MAKAELSLLNSAFSEFTKASESLITYYNSLETQIREQLMTQKLIRRR